MVKVLGIDPGLNGAAAVYDTAAPDAVSAFDLPTVGEDTKRVIDVGALARWVEAQMPFGERQDQPPRSGDNRVRHHAFVEYVTAMQDWGVGSAFRFGMSFGSLRATVALCGIPYTLVVPVKWKKFYGLKGGDKEGSRLRAIQLFPQAGDLFERVKDHQRAEAALIAAYGAKILQGA